MVVVSVVQSTAKPEALKYWIYMTILGPVSSLTHLIMDKVEECSCVRPYKVTP